MKSIFTRHAPRLLALALLSGCGSALFGSSGLRHLSSEESLYFRPCNFSHTEEASRWECVGYPRSEIEYRPIAAWKDHADAVSRGLAAQAARGVPEETKDVDEAFDKLPATIVVWPSKPDDPQKPGMILVSERYNDGSGMVLSCRQDFSTGAGFTIIETMECMQRLKAIRRVAAQHRVPAAR